MDSADPENPDHDAAKSDAPEPRATCYRCRKPAVLCLCARMPSVANRTSVFVLQHRRERFHAVGTARIARLGLERVEVLEAAGVVDAPALQPGAALLYPGPDARDLAQLAPDERPSQLVVLDGTWHHARRLFLDNPWLQSLPQVRLDPSAPSRYRIRKQPAEHCVSTLESVVEALRLLEPETEGLDGLIEVFDSMVDDQIPFMTGDGDGSAPRFQRRMPRASRALPRSLRETPERALLVYGETVPAQRVDGLKRRQLVRWTAWNPARRAGFDRLVSCADDPPNPAHLEHMGIPLAAHATSAPLDEVARDWRAFRRDDELLVAWHPAVLRMHDWLGEAPGEHAVLRSLWSNVTQGRPGGLDVLVARLGLEPAELPFPGRAAERLGRAAAVLEHLLAVAPELARAPL